MILAPGIAGRSFILSPLYVWARNLRVSECPAGMGSRGVGRASYTGREGFRASPTRRRQNPRSRVTPWIDNELSLLRYWITERERLRKVKEGGGPKPWTADPLLRDFRWCNVRRMDDRVSRELFERWYPTQSTPGETDLTYALFARLINWPEAVDEVVGHLDSVRPILLERAARGQKVFTGAYVVPGVPG